jgi:signal transduction histidine kinase
MGTSLFADQALFQLRTERFLAHARVALIVGELVAVYFDQSGPSPQITTLSGVLVAYGAWSGVVAWAVQSRNAWSPWAPSVVHLVDVLLTAILTFLSSGSSVPLFGFVVFTTAAAASRGGVRGALQTTGVLLAVVLVEAGVAGDAQAGVSAAVVRTTYLLITGYVVGYLAEKDRANRVAITSVAQVLAHVRDARTYSAGMLAVADDIATLFDVNRVWLTFETPSGERYCWVIPRSANASTANVLPINSTAEYDDCFFALDADTFWCERASSARNVSLNGDMLVAGPGPPENFWHVLGCATVLGHAVTLEGGWRARMYLPDPATARPRKQVLQTLDLLARHVAPALHNLYLARRLRSQAVSTERARLARELHDRVVQSLIVLEIQLSLLARHASSPEIAEPLSELRTQVQREIAGVRDLMHDLRPLKVQAAELPALITDTVAGFGRETGIRTTCDAHLDGDVRLSASRCGELARLLSEALINIRKHSGATAVRVELVQDGAGLRLTIADNGRGFGFSGRFTDEELPAQSRPLVIQERARAIGASLSIESTPGTGARLDVTLRYAS